MNDFTYMDILLLYELVTVEERKLRKQIAYDFWRDRYNIFRPGLYKRLNHLLDLQCKLDSLEAEINKGE